MHHRLRIGKLGGFIESRGLQSVLDEKMVAEGRIELPTCGL
jgi:hypothetical protein